MAPLTSHVIILKDHHPHHLTKYESKGTKISVFKFFSELWIIWKCNLTFSKMLISHLFYELGKTWKYTQPQTNISKPECWIYGWVGKTYVLIWPSLLMGNSYKRRWSHFKLNINDWDIPFPNILRIYWWIGKNIFHWGKLNELIKLIR